MNPPESLDLFEWIDVLFVYGPFALLVLFLFVGLKISHKHWRTAEPDNRKVFLAIYLTNWIVVFALAVFSTFVWYKINITETFYSVRLDLEIDAEGVPVREENIEANVLYPSGEKKDVNSTVRLRGGGKFMVTFEEVSAGDIMELKVVSDGEVLGIMMIPVPPKSSYKLTLE